MNALWLAMQEHDDPRWMTWKQAADNKWSVKKGAKATMISFVKPKDPLPVTKEKEEAVLAAEDTPGTSTWRRPLIVHAFVFNAEQIEGIPEWKQALGEQLAEQKWSPIERAEQIILSSKAIIRHGGNEAYYSPSGDRIQMPQKVQFDSAAKYYATLLHELGHWSGNENRLNRDLSGRYGTADYAKEELRAEIASLMMGSELNIGHNFGQHAAYVESWIKILKNDPAELFKASADAQRITDYVLAFELKQELSLEAVEAVTDKLVQGDIIPYKDTAYEVLTDLKNKTCQIQDTVTGSKTKLRVNNGLYASLLLARKNPPAQANSRDVADTEECMAGIRGYE